MTEQTIQIKLLSSALELSRAEIVEIIALGGVTVSRNRVDTWMRRSAAQKNATGNSDRVGTKINRAGTINPDEFHAFCVGLKPWLDKLNEIE